MASICKGPDGRRSIQFKGPDGKRKTLRLGKLSHQLAEKIRIKVEALSAAKNSDCPFDDETAKWLDNISDDLRDKLTAVGLANPRAARARLGEFLDDYIKARTDIKDGSRVNLQACQRRLQERFGKDKYLRDITTGDADGFDLWLKELYSPGTAGRFVKRAKQFFRAAVRAKLIRENPFADIKGSSPVDETRQFHVSQEIAHQVIDACPDAEWRLLFALSRFGGLRCPSEHLALEWTDIDWARERFKVTSSKTKHQGKGSREVPIFPELRPYLEDAFELAQESGAIYVITRYRDTNMNLRTQFGRILKRAGLTPWPKLFHNLRASRQTELEDKFPGHVVCKWLGNTTAVARKHYLHTTEEHFRQAVQGAAKSDARSSSPALQKPTQQPIVTSRSLPQDIQTALLPFELQREATATRENMPEEMMTPTGFEPVSRP